MNNPLLIAPIVEHDVSELKALAELVMFESVDAPENEKEFLVPHIKQDIEKHVSDPTCVFLKASEKNIVGFILIKEYWHLSHLFIRPDCQSRGLGAALLEHSLHAIRAKENRGYLCLNSSRNAVGFYEKMGFVIDEGKKPKSESTTPMRYDI